MHLFELRWFYYFLNYERDRSWIWNGPRMGRMRHAWTPQGLRDIHPPFDSTPEGLSDISPPDGRTFFHRIRWMRRVYGRTMDYIVHRNAGWHFSYMGGIDAVVKKFESYMHVHPDALKERSYLAQRITEGRSYDPADPGHIELRTIDDSFPAYLRQNVEKFRALIAGERRLEQLQ